MHGMVAMWARVRGRMRRAVGYDTMTYWALRACGARSAGIASITNQSQVMWGAAPPPAVCACARCPCPVIGIPFLRRTGCMGYLWA